MDNLTTAIIDALCKASAIVGRLSSLQHSLQITFFWSLSVAQNQNYFHTCCSFWGPNSTLSQLFCLSVPFLLLSCVCYCLCACPVVSVSADKKGGGDLRSVCGETADLHAINVLCCTELIACRSVLFGERHRRTTEI